MISWPSASINQLFELLDTDRARYLTWSTTAWLQGEAPTIDSGIKFTKAQQRAMQQRRED